MASWSVQRRVIYFLIVFGFLAAVGVALYLTYKPKPTCFDGIQNQDELGVDCGGGCQIACVEQIAKVKPLWTRVFRVRDGEYEVAALIENANRRYGLPELHYRIKVVDADNVLIKIREGKTVLNPGERLVVYESQIDTGERLAARAFIEFDQQIPWQKMEKEKPEISIIQRPFQNESQPKLEVAVRNNSVFNLKNIKLSAVLSDPSHNAFAASGSLLEALEPGQEKVVTFTWPEAFAEAPTFIDIYPVVNLFELK